jgi:hypothetical protein
MRQRIEIINGGKMKGNRYNGGNIKIKSNLFACLRDVRTGEATVYEYHNLINNAYLQEYVKLIVGAEQTLDLELLRMEMFDSTDTSIIRRGFTTKISYDQSVLASSFFSETEGNPVTGNITTIRYYCGAATDTPGSGTELSEIVTDITKTEYQTLTVDYIITLVAEEG